MAAETDVVLFLAPRTREGKYFCPVAARLDMFSAGTMTTFAGSALSVMVMPEMRIGAIFSGHFLVAGDACAGSDKVGWGCAGWLLSCIFSALFVAFSANSCQTENRGYRKQNEKLLDGT